jgi:hypothetical protein
MYQRQTDGEARSLPRQARSYWQPSPQAEDKIPEELIFDKAEQAERLQQLGALRDKLAAEADEIEGQLKKASRAERSQLGRRIERRRKRADAITEIIETYQEDDGAEVKESRRSSEGEDANSS